eukprot:TRINITY_DN30785_c0_g1_i1.p1 TRINITY_DN30785_c0_g1~~TRINITY_DN30785_c0_g1_i1.p1  ORF type:complete len:529 (-),score=44.52 TRINITY_DN30785_c0_g1_i1:242-1777(-)
MSQPVAVALLLLMLAHCLHGFHPDVAKGLISRLGRIDLSSEGHPGVANATVHWYSQLIDHFSWAPTPTGEQTFKQRYFVYDAHWKKSGPIFFYCGNEANVELYVNSTGLMWEHARDFGAALVFAEHRYFGESKPFGINMMQHLSYLSMEQALADYAVLIRDLKRSWGSEESAVIAFGGSYGGMLAAWLRMKYPSAVDGSIAASAPILSFQGLRNFTDGETYWQVVTRDATEQAGSAAGCSANVRRAWSELFALGQTARGRKQLEATFRLCDETPLRTSEDVLNLALMHLNAWDTMAMGNFPYPSNYLIFQQTEDPSVMMPAFPVRVACEHMVAAGSTTEGQLLSALRKASGVLYNASKQKTCYPLPIDPNFDGIWDYLWCTEMLPQETYYARDGERDMFWPYAMNMTSIREHCYSKYGVVPREGWIADEFGGAAGASNIVFSNGLYDPWSSGGVIRNISSTAVAVVIADGAHHSDLFFSNPGDPETVKRARLTELAHIREWVELKRAQLFV